MKKLKLAQKRWLNIDSVRRCYYSWRDGVKFEKGFTYKMVKNHNLDFLERYHKVLLEDGWEKVSDVNANFSNAWAWYRRLNNGWVYET